MTWAGWCIRSLSHQLSLHQEHFILQAGQYPLSVTELTQDLASPCLSMAMRKIYLLSMAAVGAAWKHVQPCRAVLLLIREIHFTHTLGKMCWDEARARWAPSLLNAWLLPENICKYVWVFLYVCVCVCVCACILYMHTHTHRSYPWNLFNYRIIFPIVL